MPANNICEINPTRPLKKKMKNYQFQLSPWLISLKIALINLMINLRQHKIAPQLIFNSLSVSQNGKQRLKGLKNQTNN